MSDFIFDQKRYPNSAHIIDDGTKFLGVYEKDYENFKYEHPNAEIWETHSEWTQSMTKTIKEYNEQYY